MSKTHAVLFALGYVGALVLVGLGAIFLMAAVYDTRRFITGGIMIAAGVAIMIGIRLRQRVEVTQKVTLKPKAIKQLKCRNCDGTLSEKDITIKADTVIVKCPYCGELYELADEPIW